MAIVLGQLPRNGRQGADKFVHCLDLGDGFTGGYMYQNFSSSLFLSKCILLYTSYTSTKLL